MFRSQADLGAHGTLMSWTGRDLVSIRELVREDIDQVMERAGEHDTNAPDAARLAGKVLAVLFFEPSTRTRLSFETAMHRLGGRVIGFGSSEGTSASKGESLVDAVRVVDGYCDAIVLRHPDQGSAEQAAAVASKPIINAGDGAGEHPTQALLDLYTIHQRFGAIDGRGIIMLGDLRHGRTVHSLLLALRHYDVDVHLVHPDGLGMPEDVLAEARRGRARVHEAATLAEALPEADVLYVTRVQKERFGDDATYRAAAGAYRIDAAMLSHARDDLVVLHPLPRVDEIADDVDKTSHAGYFRQAHNGVPTRMAVLDLILGGTKP